MFLTIKLQTKAEEMNGTRTLDATRSAKEKAQIDPGPRPSWPVL
jgi:hypothetical protein